MRTSEGITNEAIVLEWLVSSALWLQSCEKAMGSPTAQCKILLFCLNIILKESHNYELACLKKKEEFSAIWW